jgi:hypothetical protein
MAQKTIREITAEVRAATAEVRAATAEVRARRPVYEGAVREALIKALDPTVNHLQAVKDIATDATITDAERGARLRTLYVGIEGLIR